MSPLRHKDKTDHVSHKVIEKRRRDRINNCLAELSQSVPAAFTKQTAGKLEKAEILEMTVEYLRAINSLNFGIDGEFLPPAVSVAELQRHFTIGYSECLREVLRYVTEVEGFQLGDLRCTRMIGYLQSKGADLLESIWSSVFPFPPLRSSSTCLCCYQPSSSSTLVATTSNPKSMGCLTLPAASVDSTSNYKFPRPLDSNISYENVYSSYYHNLSTFSLPDFSQHKTT
ncbi:hypothetical protein CHUAL_001862 [Chamberlinius hualienensis]